MATEVERLIVSLEARTKEYERQLAKAQGTTVRELKKIEREVQRSQARQAAQWSKFGKSLEREMMSAFGGLGLRGGIVAGLTLGAAKLRQMVADVARIADEAKRTSLSIEDIQAFKFAGQQMGGDPEKFVGAIQKMNLELAEAANKGNDLGKILAANNVKLNDAAGNLRPTRDLFFDIVNLIGRARNDQERMLIINAAFGRGAADLLPVFRDGADALRDMLDAARDTGNVIDEELVRKADEFDDAWNSAWGSFSAKGSAAALRIGQQLGALITQADNWLRSVTPGIENGAIGNFLDSIGMTRERMTGSPITRNRKGDRLSGPMSLPVQQAPLKRKPLEITLTNPTIIPDLGDGGGGGGKRSRSSRSRGGGSGFNFQDDIIRQLKEEVQQLELQRQALGKSEGAAAAMEARQRALNEAMRAGHPLTAAQTAELDKITAELQQSTDALEQARQQMQLLEEAGEAVTSNLESAFDDWLETGKVDVKDFVNSVLKDLARLAFHQGIQSLLGGGSGGGGIFGAIGSIFGGMFADGGRPPVGKASIVGERGPELFVPTTAGRIIPNHGLGAQPVHIMLELSDDLTAKVDGRINKHAPKLVQVSVRESQKQTKKHMGGYLADFQARRA